MTESEQTEPNVFLRPVTEADWPLLLNWLRDPDVQRWWGRPSAVEAEIRLVLETPSALGRIIECDGKPVGYIHAIDATHWGEQLPDVLPEWTWDIDIVVAERAYRGRDIGPNALNQLAAEVFGSTFAMALSVFVSVKNEAAVRAYERAGFKWVTVWEDPIAGPQWLMLRERRSAGSGG
ncbi:MAG: acetyltransferase [Alphaproteobacteria bacterium]|nr:acetyltransferase [Alphaproteobacteria bacterium]